MEPRRRRRWRERIYIIPTKYGLIWFGVSLVMVMAGSSAGNNLVFLAAFTLLAIFVVAMLATHRNLKGLEIERVEAPDVYADELGRLKVWITNPSSRVRLAVEVLAQSRKHRVDEVIRSSVDKKGETALSCYWRHPGRGRHGLPRLVLRSVYPLGLFVCWKVFSPQGECYVYPSRLGDRALPPPDRDSHAGFEVEGLGSGEPEDFREHQRTQVGEGLARVDWKILARRGVMMSKRYDGPKPRHYRFQWGQLGSLAPEARLSQLAKWLDQVQHQRAAFELKLPQAHLSLGYGPQHLQRCLRALASFEEAS